MNKLIYNSLVYRFKTKIKIMKKLKTIKFKIRLSIIKLSKNNN